MDHTHIYMQQFWCIQRRFLGCNVAYRWILERSLSNTEVLWETQSTQTTSARATCWEIWFVRLQSSVPRSFRYHPRTIWPWAAWTGMACQWHVRCTGGQNRFRLCDRTYVLYSLSVDSIWYIHLVHFLCPKTKRSMDNCSPSSTVLPLDSRVTCSPEHQCTRNGNWNFPEFLTYALSVLRIRIGGRSTCNCACQWLLFILCSKLYPENAAVEIAVVRTEFESMRRRLEFDIC